MYIYKFIYIYTYIAFSGFKDLKIDGDRLSP